MSTGRRFSVGEMSFQVAKSVKILNQVFLPSSGAFWYYHAKRQKKVNFNKHNQQKGRSMKKLMTIVVSALCASVSFTSSAEVITWTGGAGDHKWETRANWDLGRVPNVATDDIVVGPFDELTVISNFDRTAYTIDKSLTVKKNAKMRWTTVYGLQQRVGDHGRLIVEEGGQYVLDPTEGVGTLNVGFSVRGSVWMYPGSLIENMKHAYSPNGGFGPSWRLMGGMLDLASSGSWTFMHRVAICGTEIWSPYLQPEDDVSVHVLDLISGSLKVEGSLNC